MEELIKDLKLKSAELRNKTNNSLNLEDDILENLFSVYPFNRFEYIFAHLIAYNIINLDQYLTIRSAYLDRNKFLNLYEISAPRTFGETWAQGHLLEFAPELKKPSKDYDPNYKGQYDFWYESIRIEVKASRAVKRKSGGPLVTKAIPNGSKLGFDMNYQQIKPVCCDVFVWIAVWTDVIKYWVLSTDEVKGNKYYQAKMHRFNSGEGQLWIRDTNISEFSFYETEPKQILEKIVEKGNPVKQKIN